MKKVVLTTIAVVIAAVAAQAQSVRADVGMMTYMLPRTGEKAAAKTQPTKLGVAVERKIAQCVTDESKQNTAKTKPVKRTATTVGKTQQNGNAEVKSKTGTKKVQSREDLRLAVSTTAAGQPFK